MNHLHYYHVQITVNKALKIPSDDSDELLELITEKDRESEDESKGSWNSTQGKNSKYSKENLCCGEGKWIQFIKIGLGMVSFGIMLSVAKGVQSNT